MLSKKIKIWAPREGAAATTHRAGPEGGFWKRTCRGKGRKKKEKGEEEEEEGKGRGKRGPGPQAPASFFKNAFLPPFPASFGVLLAVFGIYSPRPSSW